MGYICSRCNEVVHGNVNRLVWHIRNRHALMSGHRFTCPIMCGQDGCLQTVRFSVAFKRHIENKHKNTDLNNGHNENDDDGDDDQDDNPPNNGSLDDIPPPSVNNILNKDEVTELAASTIAKLKSSSSVVQSTVDVVSESSNMFSQIIESLKNKTEQLLESKGIANEDPEKQDLIEMFHNFQHPFQQLETALSTTEVLQSDWSFYKTP